MTPFAKKILEYLQSVPRQEADTWQIAQNAFPDTWKHRHTHGGLISRIRVVARNMPEIGIIPAKDRWGAAILYIKGRI